MTEFTHYASATWLIPAHAGKTDCHSRRRAYDGAHPRSRGENRVRRSHPSCSVGSSPLTRGKRDRISSCRYEARLIPAHAGKTGRQTAYRRHESAHPRSRGENARNGPSSALRGWLIPAHAGKTRQALVDPRAPRAHPRSRGENALMRAVAADRIGSSPLTRGKRRGRTPTGRPPRLIPAHAGKTHI